MHGGYICVNCNHHELPDPLNLSRMYPFRCKRCGLDYRIKSSQASDKVKGTTAGDIDFAGARGFSGPKYPKVSLFLGVIVFLSALLLDVFYMGSPLGPALLVAGFLGVIAYFLLLPFAILAFFISIAYFAIGLIGKVVG